MLLPLVALLSGCFVPPSAQSNLFTAVEAGDALRVRDAIAQGADVNAPVVTRSGMRVLLGGPFQDSTPLLVTAARTNAATIQALLEGGADVNAAAEDGTTALMAAANAGYGEALGVLLEHRPVIDQVDEHGRTALMWAVHLGTPHHVRLLLDVQADPTKRDKNGHSAEDLTAGGFREFRHLTKKYVASAVAKMQGQVLPSRRAFEEAQTFVHLDTDDPLRPAELSPGELDPDGWSPLMWAVVEPVGVQTIRPLIRAGADANGVTSRGWTALMGAAFYANTEAVRELLEAGANVNVAEGIAGFTPLMYAAMSANPDTVSVLLAAGADPKVRCKHGRTAKDWIVGFDPRTIEEMKLLLDEEFKGVG